jgi:hypothetical protein
MITGLLHMGVAEQIRNPGPADQGRRLVIEGTADL